MNTFVEKRVMLNDCLLTAIKSENEVDRIYTPISDFCEHLGIASNKQIEKIKKKIVFKDNIKVIPLPTNGGVQDKFCLEVSALPMWLVMINENKCREEVRPILIEFQLKAKEVLEKAFINRETIINQEINYKDKYYSLIEEVIKLKTAFDSKIISVDQETIRKAQEYDKIFNDTNKLYDFNTVAKMYNMGRNTLFTTCQNFGLLNKDNSPKQSYIDRKWFKITISNIYVGGSYILQPTTRFTALGIEKVRKILATKGYVIKE